MGKRESWHCKKNISSLLCCSNNPTVKIYDQDGNEQMAQIRGIDEMGFLEVQTQGKIVSVTPNDNSFDMLQGLIKPKTT
jgi:biotin-(acetyl-CoA carboxylase) ligase